MSSSSEYDVIVLGGGAPGEHCAAALAARGLRVAVAERELVVGECSYWACNPSKSLLRPGQAVQGARQGLWGTREATSMKAVPRRLAVATVFDRGSSSIGGRVVRIWEG
jgi:pyruvate/2-oxoglutarate dehydrogenase complex dihydrolipoamide dehydrogenase (E3) component